MLEVLLPLSPMGESTIPDHIETIARKYERRLTGMNGYPAHDGETFKLDAEDEATIRAYIASKTAGATAKGGLFAAGGGGVTGHDHAAPAPGMGK